MCYHFSFTELTKTDTGLKNVPSEMSHVENLLELTKVLENIRKSCGFPIVVNSAYRTPKVNAQVGGVVNSLHLSGRAADITVNLLNFKNNFHILKQVCVNLFEACILSECLIRDRYIHIAI